MNLCGKKQRSALFVMLGLLLCVCLYRINRDIFQYRFVYPYERVFFDGGANSFIPIYDRVSVSPAVYSVLYEGESQGEGNALCIQDSGGNILAEQPLPEGAFQESIELKIEGSARQLCLGIRFAGEGARLQVNQIAVTSSHVLNSDTILFHLTISAGVLFLFIVLILRFCFPDFWRRHVPVFFRKENKRMLLFFLLIALFSCYPLMIPNTYLSNDDSIFHLGRIEGIAGAVRSGEIPARIHLYFIQDYGYGCGFFYPQFWLCIPVLFRLLGFPVMSAYTLFMVLCSFLTGVFTCACVQHITGKKNSGMIAGILSCLASYRLIDGFFRGALGEIQTFVFLPLIVWAVYDIFCLKKDNWLLLAAGFTGLLGSHLISLAMTGMIFLLFLLGRFCCGKLKKHELLCVIKAAGATLLLGMFFLLPFWEQVNHSGKAMNFLFSSQKESIDPNFILSRTSLFRIFSPWGTPRPSPWPGLPLLGVCVLLFIPVKESSSAVKTARVLGIFSLLSLWISTDLFPWENFSWLFQRIQFSWRFLLIPTAFLPIAGGILIPEVFCSASEKLSVICVLVISLLFAEPILYETVQKYIIDAPHFILPDDSIGGGEYLPQRMNKWYVYENWNTVKYGGEALRVRNQSRRGVSFTFDFALDELKENAVMEIPLTFYYGYQAELRQEDGTILFLTVEEGPNGLTAIRDLPASSGTISVFYQKTRIQRVSEAVSLLTLAAPAARIIARRRRKQLPVS